MTDYSMNISHLYKIGIPLDIIHLIDKYVTDDSANIIINCWRSITKYRKNCLFDFVKQTHYYPIRQPEINLLFMLKKRLKYKISKIDQTFWNSIVNSIKDGFVTTRTVTIDGIEYENKINFIIFYSNIISKVLYLLRQNVN